MRKIYLFLYYYIAKHLPISYHMFGGIATKIRRIICKKLFLDVGDGVNIEQGAIFGNGSSISIGHN